MRTLKMSSKVSPATLAAFYVEWLGTAAFSQQRFGQAFLNRFFVRAVDPEVFYERDPTRAYELIYERYVNTD
jgi:hypothetical protein